MMLALWLWALVCSLCVVYLYCEWRRRAEDTDNEPPMFSYVAWPILGHAVHLLGNRRSLFTTGSVDVANECYQCGGVISVAIGPKVVYVITDPDDYFTVANNCLEKANFFYDFAKPWLGDGLETSDVVKWKLHRKLLNPAFSQVVTDGFLGVFNQQARRLVDQLAAEVNKGPFDQVHYIKRIGIQTICLTAVGVDASDHMLMNNEYLHNVELLLNTLAERGQKFWLLYPFMFRWSELKRRQDEYIKVLHDISNKVLQMRRDEFNKSVANGNSTGIKFKPFMDRVLEQQQRGVFTEQEVREHLDTIVFAGHDTSASTLGVTLLMLGSHPDVQERVYLELCEVLGETDRDLEKQDLSRLVYMEAVLKETMRLFPIAPIIARQLETDIKLKNYTLAAGRTCALYIYAMQRHPMWGADANQFCPERWLDPARLPPSANAFSPFSVGRRMCIGKSYAMKSMKVTLAHVLRRYMVRGDHTRLRLKLDVMLKPAKGHHISIETRTH